MANKEIEYIGMRFAFLSGGSHKVVIPKPIVEELWHKITELLVPVCFLKSGNDVIIEDIENIMRNPALYGDDFIDTVRNDWNEYAFRKVTSKEKALLGRFLSGEINELFYNQQLNRYRQPYHNISKQFRAILVSRGLHFGDLKDDRDISEMESLLVEREKDEECSELVERIEAIINERRDLQETRVRLEEQIKARAISKKLGESLRLKLERELSFNEGRLERLKKAIASAQQ